MNAELRAWLVAAAIFALTSAHEHWSVQLAIALMSLAIVGALELIYLAVRWAWRHSSLS